VAPEGCAIWTNRRAGWLRKIQMGLLLAGLRNDGGKFFVDFWAENSDLGKFFLNFPDFS
jgi:hypothetical protein